jgi:isocitrate dehydrogenase
LCILGEKIVVKNPVVELDGDEMTRIIWRKIREEVVYPLPITYAGADRLLLVPCTAALRTF